MTRKLLVLILILALWLGVLSPVSEAYSTGVSVETVPGVIDTTTEQVTTSGPIGGDQGWINVNCNVDGASVYFDGTYEGTISGGTLSVQVATEGTPISTITVSKDGYTSWSGSPSGMPSPGQYISVSATLIAITTIPTTLPPGAPGWIDVYCNVDGASVYFDGVYQGTIAQGLLSVQVSSSGSPVSAITVSEAGYTTWSGSLSAMPEPAQHVQVYATINPLTTIPTTIPTTTPPPSTGTIYAQSSPAGAAIYMNGNFYGYSPLTIPSLAPGTYSMKASLSGYTPDYTVVTVYASQTAYYYPTLQQSPQPRQTGSVYVTSSPNHASLYIDGSYYGVTPLTVTLYPGTHQFVCKYPGYNDYSTNVMVSGGQSRNLPVTMSTATQGTVVITSVPGASVYIDSNAAGTTGTSGSLTLTGITTGNHLFKVTAPGYNTWLNTVYIQANTVNTISAPLTPQGVAPTPIQQTGGLAISSSPSGADTYVDNLYRGITPLTINDLSPGNHQVRLSESGYVDYTTTTMVTSGQIMPLALTLTAAPSPTPTPTPAPGMVQVFCVLAALAGISGYIRRRC